MPFSRTSHRKICQLEWARACPPPSFAPQKALRGTRGEGQRFEKATWRALPGSVRGQWFEFLDANGPGYCQPDILWQLPRRRDGSPGALVVVECKRTWVPGAQSQLLDLYLPVIAAAYGKTARPVVVCKHLVPEVPRASLFSSMKEALASACHCPVVHWLGNSSIL